METPFHTLHFDHLGHLAERACEIRILSSPLKRLPYVPRPSKKYSRQVRSEDRQISILQIEEAVSH